MRDAHFFALRPERLSPHTAPHPACQPCAAACLSGRRAARFWPVRQVKTARRLRKMPAAVAKSVSHGEICNSRCEMYNSQCEIDFVGSDRKLYRSGRKLSQACGRFCQPIRRNGQPDRAHAPADRIKRLPTRRGRHPAGLAAPGGAAPPPGALTAACGADKTLPNEAVIFRKVVTLPGIVINLTENATHFSACHRDARVA